MLRKLILGGIPVFVAVQPLGSMQAVLAQVVIITFMAATIWIHPFLDIWDNIISISSMGSKLCTSPMFFFFLVSWMSGEHA